MSRLRLLPRVLWPCGRECRSAQDRIPDIGSVTAGGVQVRKFQRGAARLHIRHHAAEEEIHSAWMTQELVRHGYQISPGTLYPAAPVGGGRVAGLRAEDGGRLYPTGLPGDRSREERPSRRTAGRSRGSPVRCLATKPGSRLGGPYRGWT